MNEESYDDIVRSHRFFEVEDHGEVAVLRFGLHIPEHATDLGEAGRLWEFLAGRRGNPKKVILIVNAPGSLSPAGIDEFWDHIHYNHSKVGSTSAETLDLLRLAREENALKHFVEIIRRTDSFVISAIQGECDFCFLGTSLACDYRIAAHDSVFVNRLFESETTAGVLPWFLSRFLGHAAAADILLEGRSLTAGEAYELKLVNQLALPANLEETALETARRFAGVPDAALRALKRSLVASVENLGVYLDQIGTGFQHVKGPPATGTW